MRRVPASLLLLFASACGPPAVPAASAAARARVRVVMYTTRWCPVCARARGWLHARGIPYEERDVELDPVAAREHRRLDPARTVPVLAIEGEGVMVGFVADELRRRIDRAAHRRCAAAPGLEGCPSRRRAARAEGGP